MTYIYIYMCVCVCACVCLCIYIYKLNTHTHTHFIISFSLKTYEKYDWFMELILKNINNYSPFTVERSLFWDFYCNYIYCYSYNSCYGYFYYKNHDHFLLYQYCYCLNYLYHHNNFCHYHYCVSNFSFVVSILRLWFSKELLLVFFAYFEVVLCLHLIIFKIFDLSERIL